jgi:polyisoprenyl-phosphate glycosyltransferase
MTPVVYRPPGSAPLLALVVPCYDEAEAFPHLRAALESLRSELLSKYHVEVVLIDDGSRDNTWPLIRQFAASCDWVRGAALSRNFGHQAALTCGLTLARGDAVVSLDADLQDPPAVVLEMAAVWENGADIVYAVRRSRAGETAFKKATAALFYRLARRLGAKGLRADAGDFRLMSRRSLDALLAMPEQHRFLRGMVGWVGFRTADVHYDRAARVAGTTKYPLRKMLRLAADAVVSSSSAPLKFPYYCAILLSLLIIFTALAALALGGIGPGDAAVVFALVLFGSGALVSLGILGEYVGRIYEQVKARPLFLVKEAVNAAAEPLRRAA